jgi:hypothetical protein
VRSATTPPELAQAVHDNLRNLSVDVLEVVNFRVMILWRPCGRLPPGEWAKLLARKPAPC